MSGQVSWSPINDNAARVDALRRSGLKCRVCEVRHGRSNRSGNHVRRRRHAAVASLTREHAEAVRALDRTGIDLPTGACAHNGSRTVCAPDRDHQCRLSLRGGGAIGRARHRGGHRARADAARFWAGGHGCRRARGRARPQCPGAGARGRPRHSQARRIPRYLSKRGVGRGRGADHNLWHRAHRSRYELRLYPSRQKAQRRIRARGRRLRREARCRYRSDVCRRPLPLEQRQFPVSCRDDAGNATDGPVVMMDSRNSLVRSDESVLTTVVGLDDVIVVSTADAVLVASRAKAEQVKVLVEELKRHNYCAAVEHRRIYRPWGYYQDVDIAARYRVKRIVVKPGSTLSLQKHFHRSEHWVVVKGTAEVTIGNDVRTVHENESIYIPIGSIHRLANPGKIPLELIEVQVGSYLGEDDIVRLDDVYGRG